MRPLKREIKRLQRFKRPAIFGASGLAVLAAAVGVYRAVHSPLFLVQVVEVSDLPDSAPVDAQAIAALVAVPPGVVNLFDLDLAGVERRILKNPWIKEAKLQKRFPQTLSITVVFRQPSALLESSDGTLAYVDGDGAVFGEASLARESDLPLLSGFSRDGSDGGGHLPPALAILRAWANGPLAKRAQIAQLAWDDERGYRAVVSYPMAGGRTGRSTLEIGPSADGFLTEDLDHLAKVIRYLSDHSIVARKVWTDTVKKIVVKTARGS